ncbi:prepilin-type N-terminal cleavage/methylation domain-containing protein [uncultured Tolumonas sp.]|uniref:prepilin-type N-terminal cleavage/methylation domain-containing protein n=1 Tax=uncultured Tolumonas sp. TaxID=263765 RepID=UPI002A0A9A8E|nr:prepilin-type N-terminal cleavage/methylation domain-containing protein [uncultured Tolumonas sp.]
MKRSAGFTLIELIIVIVILGILAVTAAPRFINLQNDARTSTVNGLSGAVKAAASMVYSKAIIAGQDKVSPGEVSINGSDVTLAFGYPSALAAGIGAVIDVNQNSTNDWDVTTTSTTPKTYVLTPHDYSAPSGTSCNVTYTEAQSATTPPTVVANVGGC